MHKAPPSCTDAGMNKQDKRKNDKMCTEEHMYPHIVPGNKVMSKQKARGKKTPQ